MRFLEPHGLHFPSAAPARYEWGLQILRAPSAAVRNQIEPTAAGVSAKKHFFTAVASSAGLRRALAPGENDFPGRCLDAAHGETYGTVPPVHRVHVARVEIDAPRVVVAGIVGRRRPAVALDADVGQGSRRPVAVARSRDCEAIAGMNAPPGRLGRCGADWDSKLAPGASGLLNLPDLAGRGRDRCHSGPEVVLSLGPTLQDTQRAPLGMPFVFRETDSRNTISSLQRRIP